MKIQILVDNPNSWMNSYASEFAKDLNANFIQSHDEIEEGDILVLLSCEQKLRKVGMNKYNLVVHESDLPQGKGWSPLTWQILEGKSEVTLALIEAADKIDSGAVYDKTKIQFSGDELIDELRKKQAKGTYDLINRFIRKYPNIVGYDQNGEESFYKKRGPSDSQLDMNKTIEEQFNLLRVVDNDRYPAFFVKNGKKYILRIEKDE